jgi:hypothetical protein
MSLFHKISLRSTLVAVAVIGVNAWGVAAVLRHYPRSPFMVFSTTSRGRTAFVSKSDGSTIRYKIHYSSNGRRNPYDLCMTRPARPTSLRIWIPIALSLTASLIVVGVGFAFRRLSRWAFYVRLPIWAILCVLVWLSLPLFQIAAHPLDDYHAHPSRSGNDLCYYATPFRTRYLSLLLHDGRPCGCMDNNDGSRPTIKNKIHSYYDVFP